MPQVRLEPVPFVEAIKAASQQKVVLPAVYYGQIPAEVRAAAFTITGLARVDQIERVLDSLQRVLTEGGTFDQWRQAAAAGDLGLPRHRMETIYRTNLQNWWNRGRAEQILDHAESHPYLMYSAVNDSRTRPEHAAMHGTILPVDHPWWREHYPPNGFNCRCRAVALTAKEAQRRGITSIPTPAQPDPGWSHSALESNGHLAGLMQALDSRQASPAVAAVGASAIEEMRRRLREPQAFSPGLRELAGEDLYLRARKAVDRAATARNVPVDAAAAVYLYTRPSELYKDLNATLRYIGSPDIRTLAVRDPDRYLPMLDGLFAAFAALPTAPTTVRRGLDSARLPAGFIENHKRGAIVRYNSVTSTAGPGARPFDGDVILVIRQRSGVLIRDLSAIPLEGEILLPPGTTFRVTRRARGSAGQLTIWLEEVGLDTLPRGTRVYDFTYG